MLLKVEYSRPLSFCLLVSVILDLVAATQDLKNKLDSNDSHPLSEEGRLQAFLLHRCSQSQTSTRPLRDSNRTVVVQFGISLVQILDLDERSQTITTALWKALLWKDENLSWRPEDYGGIKSSRIPVNKIWKPDIMLYNSIDKFDLADSHPENVVLKSDGMITWIPPKIYRSSCTIDMANYPFDRQWCVLVFGSWSYSENEINMTLVKSGREPVDLNDYVDNGDWIVEGAEATKFTKKFQCCEDSYGIVNVNITLKRKVAFHVRMMLVPTILMSYMIPLLFLIPIERPDRTSYGMSLFSSFFLLLLIVVETTPPSAQIQLGLFVCVNIILLGMSAFVSVLLLNLSIRPTSPPPVCLQKILNSCLGRLLCVGRHRMENSAGTSKITEDQLYSRRHLTLWREITLLGDRLMAVIYSILIIVLQIFVFPLPQLLTA